MLEKVIIIPFNYNDFINTQKVALRFSFKKALKNYIVYTILPVVLLTIGRLLDSIFSEIIGWLLLVYILIKWYEVYSVRKKYFKRINDYAARLSEEKMVSTYTFTENYLKYEDDEKLYQLNWSLFKSISVYKNTILITGKDNDTVTFSISKESVGEKDFDDIRAILTERIYENPLPGSTLS